MSDEPKIVSPVTVPTPARRRGPLISEDFNKVQEGLAADVQNLANAVNSLNGKLSRSLVVLQSENAYLKRSVDALKNQQDYLEKSYAATNGLVARFVDFSDTAGISFPNALDDSRSPMLSSEFGEVCLPANSTENKFYFTSLMSNKIVPPTSLIVTVKGEFDKRDGEGLVNYERGGTVIPGNPENAFNGVNTSYWIRKVEFPLDSRVDEVECELTAVIPEGSSSEVNTVELFPFPNGSVDVVELAYASDLGNNFIRVPNFTPENNAVSKKIHLAATAMDQIKIRLRQKNWVEENGKKVFYYGLQELNLKLVDYDKTYSRNASFGSNNSFILRVDAPEGKTFNQLYRIEPSPNFLSEDMSNRHVHVKLGISPDITNGTIWDSDTEYTPQQTSQPITVGSSTLYAFIELSYVSSSGGTLSPYTVGCTPFLKGIGLAYTLV